MRSPTRVLVLAGDALDDVLVRRWADEGVLPTFRRLMGEGTWATTLNPVGLYVGALWASFSTGTSPARHGRYCHHQITPGTSTSATRRPALLSAVQNTSALRSFARNSFASYVPGVI